MKKVIVGLTVLFLAGFMSPEVSIAQASAEKPILEIYYTHSTNRCAGCIAIENQTIETLENGFKTDVESGKIKFVSVNIDDAANKAFIDKYEVWGSSLFIVKTSTEQTIDLTRDGFAYARTRPEMFRERLSAAIKNNLN
jgi:hypothetical protein